jgi:hypothetical protein
VACFLALGGLAIMAYSILWPRPLPVIIAMSVGHALGILAFACYLVAVIVDVARTREPAASASTNEPSVPAAEAQDSPPPEQ